MATSDYYLVIYTTLRVKLKLVNYNTDHLKLNTATEQPLDYPSR